MYISYSSSDAYAVHTGVSIVSLLENNTDSEDIHIFLLDLGIQEQNRQKLNNIVASYKRKITFLQIDNDKIKAFLGDRIPAHYGSYATYARLCATILYPDYVDRVIYIDSDMVITGSLKSVYEFEMDEKIVAAVPLNRDYDYIAGLSAEERSIIDGNPLYFNAGFLMLDLDNWKKANFDAIISATAQSMKEYHHKDQSILNKAITQDRFYRLPFKYNYTMHRYPRYLLGKWAQTAAPLTVHEVMEAASSPIVIHYVGDQCRPWFKENTSYLANEYYKYKKMSPFRNVPLESIFDSEKFANSSAIGKAFMAAMYKTHQSRIGYPFLLINNLRIKLTRYIKRKGKR